MMKKSFRASLQTWTEKYIVFPAVCDINPWDGKYTGFPEEGVLAMASARFAVFVLLLSSAVLFFLSGSTWIRRKNAGSPAKWLSLCMSGAAIYCFGYAMELSSGTLPEMMSWIRFQHLGIQVLAPTWLLFSLHISGRQNLITTSRLFVFLSIPLFLFFSAQTLGGSTCFTYRRESSHPDLSPSLHTTEALWPG